MVSRLAIRITFEPRDFWVGVFVDKPEFKVQMSAGDFISKESWTERKIYICLIPMFPIVLAWRSDQRDSVHPTERTADVFVELQGGDSV